MPATITRELSGCFVAPARYRPRTVEVEALGYDGSSASAAAVHRWFVRRALHTVRTFTNSEGVLRLGDEDGRDTVVVRPGDVVVFDRATRAWDAVPAETFAGRYFRQPRELPIFDDGEHVE